MTIDFNGLNNNLNQNSELDYLTKQPVSQWVDEVDLYQKYTAQTIPEFLPLTGSNTQYFQQKYPQKLQIQLLSLKETDYNAKLHQEFLYEAIRMQVTPTKILLRDVKFYIEHKIVMLARSITAIYPINADLVTSILALGNSPLGKILFTANFSRTPIYFIRLGDSWGRQSFFYQKKLDSYQTLKLYELFLP